MAQSGNEERVRAIAHRVYLNRQVWQRSRDAHDDWQTAENITTKPWRRILFWSHSGLLALPKLSYRSAKFVVWEIPKWGLFSLPKLEWVKLLVVPLVVAAAGRSITRNFQRETEQNRIFKEYFALLETFTFKEGLLDQPLDSGVVILARGRTVVALRELDWSRRGQLIAFLRASNLATIKTDENSDETATNADETDQNSEENDAKAGEAVQNDGALDENADDIQEPVISFKNQDLSEMDLQNVSLSNLDFQSTNFQRVNLQDADLREANLRDAFLGEANLRDAFLGEANLQNADLGFANLQNADLGFANLQNAALGAANLQNAALGAANLQNAALGFANLQNAALGAANLQDAFLREANLQNAFLKEANLQDADLGFANLQDAFLGNANLQGADLLDANLQNLTLVVFWPNGDERGRTSPAELQAKLAEAKLCGTILPDFIELDGNRDCDSP